MTRRPYTLAPGTERIHACTHGHTAQDSAMVHERPAVWVSAVVVFVYACTWDERCLCVCAAFVSAVHIANRAASSSGAVRKRHVKNNRRAQYERTERTERSTAHSTHSRTHRPPCASDIFVWLSRLLGRAHNIDCWLACTDECALCTQTLAIFYSLSIHIENAVLLSIQGFC